MSEKLKRNMEKPNSVQLIVDGCSVKLNLPFKSEKQIMNDIKKMILSNMSKVRK